VQVTKGDQRQAKDEDPILKRAKFKHYNKKNANKDEAWRNNKEDTLTL